MAPRHVRGIDRKAPAAISSIRAKKIDARHLAAKTVVENVTDRALRKTRHWVRAERGITLPWSRRVRNQRLINRRITLELGAPRLMPGPKKRFCTGGNVLRTMPHCGVRTLVSQAS